MKKLFSDSGTEPSWARQLVMFVPVAVVLCAAPMARSQQSPPTQENTPTLRVSTEVVNVLTIVKDKKGRLIPDVNKQDFQVLEDNVPQEIRYFSKQTDTPLTLGMLVDTSPSQERVLSIEQEEAKSFIAQVIKPKDLAFVLHFDVDVELLQDFTSDRRMLSKAIDETVINGGGGGVLPGTFPTSASQGATHLYDAVYLAANDLLKNEVGRKVIILLTDGEDQGSKEKLQTALEAAQRSDLIIYSIEVSDRMFYPSRGMFYSGDSVLKKLSGDTGGRVIEVKGSRDVGLAFQEIADELRTQYLLGYVPTNTRRNGGFRKIQVKVLNQDYKIQARRGYYAPSE
ncbi:MAG TPA: VWA domain-containing protein [Terriglobia bacterium]|nr:VWA domain-containing protein [Terriglobia bacterium]